MTHIEFGTEIEVENARSRELLFERVQNLTRHRTVLRDLTEIDPDEFSHIDVPGSAIYQDEDAAPGRIAKINESAERGLAATYLVKSNGQYTGAVSLMYPDPGRFSIGKRYRKRFAPETNPRRDVAGWLRKDKLNVNDDPTAEARIVLTAFVNLAQSAGVERLGVSVSDKVAAHPLTEHLVSIDAQAPHVGFAIANDQTAQRTEGRLFPGTQYILDLTL